MSKIIPPSLNHIDGTDIFLWLNREPPVAAEKGPSGTPTTPQCQLKHFLNFVKYLDLNRWTDFAYVPEESDLLPNLTLKENLFLESIPPSLSLTKEFQFREFLQKTGNEFLLQIFKLISHPDSFPSQVLPKERKLVCFLRALLKKSEFLFLEGPSRHLEMDSEELSLIKLALAHESKKRHRVVVISMEAWEQWSELFTKVIIRAPQGRYLIQPFPLQSMHFPEEALDPTDSAKIPDNNLNFKWGR